MFITELAKEEEGGVPFRSGAITPDGLIDEDFEEELGSPSQVGNQVKVRGPFVQTLCIEKDSYMDAIKRVNIFR